MNIDPSLKEFLFDEIKSDCLEKKLKKMGIINRKIGQFVLSQDGKYYSVYEIDHDYLFDITKEAYDKLGNEDEY